MKKLYKILFVIFFIRSEVRYSSLKLSIRDADWPRSGIDDYVYFDDSGRPSFSERSLWGVEKPNGSILAMLLRDVLWKIFLQTLQNQITGINSRTLTFLAPATHWESRIRLLKLNVKMATEMSRFQIQGSMAISKVLMKYESYKMTQI